MDLLRSGRAQTVSWESAASSAAGERVFLMQVAPLHDGHEVSGYVFSSADITPSHRSRESLIDAGIALSRPIALDRALNEMAQQIRRSVPYQSLAVALVGDDATSLHLAWQTGYEETPAAIESLLTPRWRSAFDEACVTVHRRDRGIEVTIPLASADGVTGAITVVSDALGSPDRLDDARQILSTIAAQTSAAIERARHVERVEHQRRMETIGEVAAGVAHELRNPLFGISSAAQLVRFRAREDPVVETNVGRILREVDRLNRMASSLAELGGPGTLARVPGDPDAVWDAVLDRERGRIESRSLRLRRQRPEHPARCAIDRDHLAQVFTNVLINAVDGAPEGTDLMLTTTVLRSGGWRAQLHNHGPPIAADALPRVFELFFSTKPGGAGIGLAVAQRIVEAHGGSISLASDERGTTVTVVLPPTE
jgi:signal transduction histidine kinase